MLRRAMPALAPLLLFAGCAEIGNQGPQLFADPFQVDLASADFVDGNATLDVTLANTGVSNANIQSVGWAGESPDWLKITQDDDVTLAPGDVSVLQLSFHEADLATWEDQRLVLVVKATGSSNVGCGAAIPVALEANIPVFLMEPSACDGDKDGYDAQACGGPDCDDDDATVNPMADEVCNATDDDCNGVVDDNPSDPLTWYADVDSDGWGDDQDTKMSCEQPSAYARRGGDCDDLSPDVNPGAEEVCDDIDNNCSGVVDDLEFSDWYADVDADGYGDTTTSLSACAAPSGYVNNDDDCNDGDPFVHPAAIEICGGDDEDCDGDVDEAGADGEVLWYPDADGDDYGDEDGGVLACTPPADHLAVAADCNDSDATIHPAADELCDPEDRNCDGDPTDGATDTVTWYVDADLDGYGIGVLQHGCKLPEASSLRPGDCDDTTALRNPDADEVCDGIDNDCDLTVDEGTDEQTWYPDVDGDGFGDTNLGVTYCTTPPADYIQEPGDCDDNRVDAHPNAPETCNGLDDDCDGRLADNELDGDGDGFTSCDGDCDDNDDDVYPFAPESCDGLDEDCDGIVDNGAPGAEPWYGDKDGDDHGDPSTLIFYCSEPATGTRNPGDCDDDDPLVHEHAAERCNEQDDDCDGIVDEDGVDPLNWFADDDGDGFGNAIDVTPGCTAPSGHVADNTDCNDKDGATHPAAREVCGGGDEDCDGSVDEFDALGTTRFFPDVDNDGYGRTNNSVEACENPDSNLLVDNFDDCDDKEAAAFPGNPELCDGIDNDCNGLVDDNHGGDATWYLDSDSDGFGDAGTSVTTCTPPAGYVLPSSDCDDANELVNPKGDERCDGIDNDCDGAVDNNTRDGDDWFADQDDDGFGDPHTSVVSCGQPSGFVSNNDDCDDERADLTDGQSWFLDDDADGFGDADESLRSCERPGGYTHDATDCDDDDTTVFPTAAEHCNDRDDNCNGEVDEAAVDPSAWYGDGDRDGAGSPASLTLDCDPVADHVGNANDCDDVDPFTYLDAPELCDGVDNDCDGIVDNDVVDDLPFYGDNDGDGYGTDDDVVEDCAPPDGYSGTDDDCDDNDPDAHPYADEVCNAKDDDCDGTVDNVDSGIPLWLDADGDGFGDPDLPQLACEPSDDMVANDGDCNDDNPAVNPDALDVCNGVDDDCDPDTREDTLDGDIWYPDGDEDGFGEAGESLSSCDAPSDHWALTDGDCNDNDPDVNPAAAEVCSGQDDNCDGVTLANETDSDHDGVMGCAGDCDDDDSTSFPGNPEQCDGVDNDCDGDLPVSEADADSDGVRVCGGDCDDGNSGAYPGNEEWCDGLDSDCDGHVPADEIDNDNDGMLECNGDCDDDNATIYSDAPEQCDGLDNDCDGDVPASESNTDGDEYRVCDGDCDDSNASIHPGAIEQCNGNDDDCDGDVPSDESDDDGDKQAVCAGDCNDDNPTIFTGAAEQCDGLDNDCDSDVPTNEANSDGDDYRVCDGDCNDDDPAVHPDATERCNAEDDDCDGAIPADETDADGDAFSACEGDCNDNNKAINPDAPEVCDGLDNDCDGNIPTDELDADGDGQATCEGDCDDDDDQRFDGAPEQCDGSDNDCDGTVPTNEADADGDDFRLCDGDCHDGDASIFPGADERCNGQDDDCDGVVPADELDLDGDGQTGCEGDCDDDDDLRFDGAPELCDAVDNDCDGDVPVDEIDGDGDGQATCGGDCDDDNDQRFDGAAEQCDSVDNDCDGAVPADEVDDDSDGFRLCDGDCRDDEETVFPGAEEHCNGEDDDCDGLVPAGEFDEDGDGFASCDGDCNDDASDVFPGADEVCDGVDNDCSGDSEEEDEDGDGVRACDGDCDDSDPLAFPGADERCNNDDDDCDGVVPEDESDADGDVFASCEGDCDDDDELVFPGADEQCNGVDDDCDGDVPASEFDDDGDGFAACDGDCNDDATDVFPGAPELCDGVDNDCSGDTGESDVDSDGFRSCDGDCNDDDALVFPGAPERCNDLDDDCDGSIPDDETDSDGDVFAACDGDCDDEDDDVYPGAPEDCDGVDTNCDGDLSDENDADTDGWRGCDGDCDDDDKNVNPDAAELNCDGIDNNCDGDLGDGGGFDSDFDGVDDCDDCNDGNAEIYPGAPEQCNGQDDDCDGDIDEGVDEDGDGDGSTACDGDCDDLNAEIFPGQVEECDYVDQDCDNRIDEDFRSGFFYSDDAHCGFCDNDCRPLYENAVGFCDLLGFPACNYECEDGFVDVDGSADNGCECEFLSEDDEPFDDIDSNCDGTDGVPDDAVYVSRSGDDAGTGSIGDPLRTIMKGLAMANDAGLDLVVVHMGTYREDVELIDGISLVGGFDTDFEAHDPDIYVTTIDGSGGSATVIARGITTETNFIGFEVIGNHTGSRGAPAIAMWVEDSSDSLFINSTILVATDGTNGRLGTDGAHGGLGLDGGTGDGATTTAMTCADLNFGGMGAFGTCAGVEVSGGFGADNACPVPNADQPDGSPGLPVAGGGAAGSGGCDAFLASCGMCWVDFCHNPGTDGQSGLGGLDGAGGPGGTDNDGNFNSITASGWSPATGGGAGSGSAGSGGGGGGAGAGAASVGGCDQHQIGGTGGGGGAGGCGGERGTSGTGGGGSFGLVVYGGVMPTLRDSQVISGDGGRGGPGGDGGVGGSGGIGGDGGTKGAGTAWCSEPGGDGGNGGGGGAGGGAGGSPGGPSFAIYRAGGAPAADWLDPSNVLTHGSGGLGGNGGKGGLDGGAGVQGAAGDTSW
jgi:hypothetical protein